MWFFKLLLLLAIMASWFPIEPSHSGQDHQNFLTEETGVEEEEEEGEELAA